jgi:hypothetical protein
LKDRGQDGLVNALQKMKDQGRLTSTGGTGYGMRLATMLPNKKGGYHIVLVTVTPINFLQGASSERSLKTHAKQGAIRARQNRPILLARCSSQTEGIPRNKALAYCRNSQTFCAVPVKVTEMMLPKLSNWITVWPSAKNTVARLAGNTFGGNSKPNVGPRNVAVLSVTENRD